MASPKNWKADHNGNTERYPYRWKHREAPAQIFVMKKKRGYNAGTYSVQAKYKGKVGGNGHSAVSGIRNKENARKKAVKLARMYSNPNDLKEDINKVSFGASLR